jgi:hypothetical protein
MADVSGLSTFDATSDSVYVFKMSDSVVAKIEDTIHANAADYKATGFSTHSAADVWTTGSRELSTPNNYKADVSGLSTFDAATDSVIVDASAANVDDGLAELIAVAAEDSVNNNYPGNFSSLAILATGEVGIDLDNTQGTLDAAEIGADAITSSQLATSAGNELADEVWDELQAGHSTDGSFGAYVDDTVSEAGATATISDADMGAIIDSLMRRAYDDTVTGAWTAYVLRKADSAISGATATISDADMAAIADTIMALTAADSGDGSLWGQMLRQLDSAYSATWSTFDETTDSVELVAAYANWAKLRDSLGAYVLANVDSATTLDSSEVGAWLAAAASGSATVSAGDKEDIAALVRDTAQANPSYFYGPTATGSGSRTVRVYAMDTSGTDEAVTNVSVTIQNVSGTQIAGPLTTNSSGYVDFTLNDGSVTALADLSPAYYFNSKSINISGNRTDSVWGYNTQISSPSAAELSRVYGYVYDVQGNADSGRVIYVERLGGTNAIDTGGGYIVSPLLETTTTNASGYFYFDLIRTNQYDSASKGKYTIYGRKDNATLFRIDTLTIPPTGNLNLTDSILAR